MDGIGVDCWADEGLICSLIYWDFWLADCGESRTGVDGCVVYGGVAVDGGDAEEMGGWVIGGEEDGEDVLDGVNG